MHVGHRGGGPQSVVGDTHLKLRGRMGLEKESLSPQKIGNDQNCEHRSYKEGE